MPINQGGEAELGATLTRRIAKKIVEPVPMRKRGRLGTRPARVSTTDLSPGMRSALSRFERAARDHAHMGAENPQDWPAIDAVYFASKQALLRKLLRLEGTLPSDPRGRRRGAT